MRFFRLELSAGLLLAVLALSLRAVQPLSGATMPARALAAANWLTSQQVEQCFPGLIGEWVGAKHVQLADRGAISTPSEAIADMKPFALEGLTSIEPYDEHENRLQVAFDSAHGIIGFRHGAEEELELALIGGAKAPAFTLANRDWSNASLGGVRIGSPRAGVERRYGIAKHTHSACGMTLVEYASKSGTYFFDVVYAAGNVRALVYANVI